MTSNQIRMAIRKRLVIACLRSADTFVLEHVGVRHGLAKIDFLVVNGVGLSKRMREAFSFFYLPTGIAKFALKSGETTKCYRAEKSHWLTPHRLNLQSR